MATRPLQAASFHLQAREKRADETRGRMETTGGDAEEAVAEKDPIEGQRSKRIQLQPQVCLPLPPHTPEDVLRQSGHESATHAEAQPVAEKSFQYGQAKNSIIKASATSYVWKLWEILTNSFFYGPGQCPFSQWTDKYLPHTVWD